MSSRPAMLEVRDAAGNGLRVEFPRVKDRYAHVISLVAGEHATPAWESVEGTDADDWPSSPPLQQLSLETFADGRRVALLVGMAGASHWSLSVEAAPDEAALIFDVACRVKQRPQWLGSKYRKSSVDECLPLCAAAGRVEFIADESLCAIILGDSSIEVRPSELGSAFPTTVRWKYRVTLTKG